jgi:hypothetical protein
MVFMATLLGDVAMSATDDSLALPQPGIVRVL